MSTSSYELGKKALQRWREVHGSESLDQQCIRYDGYYWQWVYQGNENIRSYDTATAAADASPMNTSNVNDPNARPGDLWYWYWYPEGHVGTVLGHDKDGRVLVTHTSSSGDLVEQWSNNVRISHADTIPHRFRGGSQRYGSNVERTGLTAWPSGSASKPENKPSTTNRVVERNRKDDNVIYIYLHGGAGKGAHKFAVFTLGVKGSWWEFTGQDSANQLASQRGGAMSVSAGNFEALKKRHS